MHEALKAVGVEFALAIVPGSGHDGAILNCAWTPIIDFLDRHLEG